MTIFAVMKSKIIFLVLVVVVFFACEEVERPFANSGKLTYGGTNYGVTQARFATDSVVDGEYWGVLTFSPKRITINDNGVSGSGATYLYLSLRLPNRELPTGRMTVGGAGVPRVVAMESYMRTISDDKKDTVDVMIKGGGFDYVVQGDTMPKFVFDFETSSQEGIGGEYFGTVVENSSVDADSMGYYAVDTVVSSIGYANMWQWEGLFDSTLYYYEMELVSTDMRFTDEGKMKDGSVLFLGFVSKNMAYPADGEYTIGENLVDYGALYGHKYNNTYWGTYWQRVRKGTVVAKANITSGEVKIRRCDNDMFYVVVKMKDQLNNNLRGEFRGTVVVRSPY